MVIKYIMIKAKYNIMKKTEDFARQKFKNKINYKSLVSEGSGKDQTWSNFNRGSVVTLEL